MFSSELLDRYSIFGIYKSLAKMASLRFNLFSLLSSVVRGNIDKLQFRAWLCKDLNLVQTHKCWLLIMGLHIFEKIHQGVWDLICGTSWSYKSRTEKVTAGRKSAILPNWCCLLFITVLSGYPCLILILIILAISFHFIKHLLPVWA